MKEQAKFTAGPWRVLERDDPKNSTLPFGIERAYSACVEPIADIMAYPPNKRELIDHMRANARLIAAAPEMFVVLKELLVHLEAGHLSGRTVTSGRTRERYEDAIRKLTATIEGCK